MSQLISPLFIVFWASLAMAQNEAPQEPGFLANMFPWFAILFIVYFFMLRPSIKKQKTQQEFLQALKKGDRVLTSSGIFGTIEGLTDKYVKLEIAEDVSIRVLKAHVSQPVKEG